MPLGDAQERSLPKAAKECNRSPKLMKGQFHQLLLHTSPELGSRVVPIEIYNQFLEIFPVVPIEIYNQFLKRFRVVPIEIYNQMFEIFRVVPVEFDNP